ncbi:hypothetical protein [Saccharomonospora xinjiangensis]|uniref:hypothetical protein n=1 Tax=Saccharomonospora xinjiangensis TaxID=75294 RepID=UPI0010703A17|nr:hypothetical protein [Saccharomonospora xinjiangensis]
MPERNHVERARTFLHLADQLLAAADRELLLAIGEGEIPPRPAVAGASRERYSASIDVAEGVGSTVSVWVVVNAVGRELEAAGLPGRLVNEDIDQARAAALDLLDAFGVTARGCWRCRAGVSPGDGGEVPTARDRAEGARRRSGHRRAGTAGGRETSCDRRRFSRGVVGGTE